MIKRGSQVEIEGKIYTVTKTEHYGFFVEGRPYIILWSDDYRIVSQ